MPRVLHSFQVDHAIALRKEGLSHREIGERVGFHEETIRKALSARGVGGYVYRPAHNAKHFDREEATRLYAQGVSVKALATRYGVQRKTVADHLQRAGVTLRGRSGAMLVRMAHATPEERKRLASAAHDAVRGKPKSDAHRHALARTKTRRVGIGEKQLARLFLRHGIRAEAQHPVDMYNLDFAVRHVAVELRAGSGNPLTKAHQRKRLEHLFDRGWSVLFVLVASEEALAANAEHVIADVQRMGRLPPGSRQHRMVRCHFEAAPFARGHGNKFLPGKRTTERPAYTVCHADDLVRW